MKARRKALDRGEDKKRRDEGCRRRPGKENKRERATRE